MATRIVFAAAMAESVVTLVVQESPTEVDEALTAAHGLPFRLTSKDKPVHANPPTIAYWHERGSSGRTVMIR